MKKFLVVTAVLIGLFAQSAHSSESESVRAISNQSKVVDEYEFEKKRDLVDSLTCESIHNASFTSLELDGIACKIQDCTIILGKEYKGHLEFIAGKTEWNVLMEISFVALPSLQNISRVFSTSSNLFRNFTKGETVKMQYSINFYENEFKNKSGPYRLQFQLFSSSTKDKAMFLCESVLVNLIATSNQNDANVHAADCVLLGHPCAFDHSTCAKNGTTNTCQCESPYYFETGKQGCKRLVDENCLTATDCLTNAECKNEGSVGRKCACTEGFFYNKSEFSCKNCASSIVQSMLAFFILQLALLTFN